ncbi:hypothetical protein CJD36_014685 [Flavipsychrobacter stenotrophus]|uniref:DUF6036 domain-containing protein n=1 Tax=Flavipsychrobacter stenotrophus TaxID=2077091 RepID=A0A2S7STV1_9BACT|nr:DUF6036 family nucleotidyltransferase [Flavipsychrobacter stenotrophus]PQJ09946.1 hypothetical protein CJD36_014685 [Flavipsychrobacter stenotrophus]
MDTNLAGTLCKVCGVLNKHSVEYLIVGGIAVAIHGYFRLTTDMSGRETDKPDFDFWYNATYNNYFRLLDAIEELGQDVTDIKNETTPDPQKSFFKIDMKAFSADFLPGLPGLSNFKESFKQKKIIVLQEVDIFFISYDDLLLTKIATARPKDLDDIEHLKQRRDQ